MWNIKMGVYKEPSFNQTTFCYEITPPDTIRIWRENPNGEIDEWWTQTISPKKFHWLVDEYNKGNVHKIYPHWWEKVDTRPAHINSLLQLTHEGLIEVFNYYGYILPHNSWNIDDEHFLLEDYRPIWKEHKIIGYTIMSRERANEYNAQEDATCYYGFTDEEIIERNLR